MIESLTALAREDVGPTLHADVRLGGTYISRPF